MRSLVLGLAAAVLASACAPMASFRPPSALVRGDENVEMGAGAVLVEPRPYVQESSHGMGQLWFTERANRWLTLSAVGAFDKRSALGGAEAMGRFVMTDRFVAASAVEAGFAWVGTSLSGAVRLVDDTWIYAAPRLFNWGKFAAGALPAGLSARIGGGLILRVELQLSWQDFEYYNRRVHLGAAAAYAW